MLHVIIHLKSNISVQTLAASRLARMLHASYALCHVIGRPDRPNIFKFITFKIDIWLKINTLENLRFGLLV